MSLPAAKPKDVRGAKIRRHWCAVSEKLTGGDSLITALDEGWQPTGIIFCQEFWLSGTRRVVVYHLTLERAAETLKMVISQNPFVTRFVHQLGLQIVQINQHN